MSSTRKWCSSTRMKRRWLPFSTWLIRNITKTKMNQPPSCWIGWNRGKMGSYDVWVIVPAGPRDVVRTALEMIQPYDEENDIAGSWMGNSFDYCEPLDIQPAGALGAIISETPERAPSALVTPQGMITLRPNDGGDNGPELVGAGPEEMVRALESSPARPTLRMSWHS